MLRTKAIKFLALLPILVVISACVSEGGRKGRPLIADFSIGGSSESGASLCNDFFDPVTAICRTTACPSGTHEADADERAELKSELLQQKIDIDPTDTEANEVLDFILQNFDVQNTICAAGSGINRPTRQVFVKNDYCSCNNGVPDILNNCAAFCSTKPNTNAQPVLFGSVTLGPDILLNEDLGSLEKWCNQPLVGDDSVAAPRCALRVFDASNNVIDLDISIPTDSNSFSANLGSLQVETPYVAQIIEVQSGSNSVSDEFQLYRIPAPTGQTTVGPLKIMPISQYTCVQWAGSVTGLNISYDALAKLYFNFPSNQEPVPILNINNGSNQINIYCHDLQLYGETDSPLFPRLELIPQHFSLWDFSDTRLADVSPQDGNSDINQTIIDRLQTEFNVAFSTRVFNPFPVTTRPNVGNNQIPTQVAGGFFMVPWINPQTGRAFCPKQAEYNGTNPVFKVIKDYVGVDTEGIYAAIKQPELLLLPDGTTTEAPQSFMFIRENLLKQIWFYTENNQTLIPNDVTAGQKTLHYYWPPDTQDPYSKKDYQRIFTIRGANDLNTNSAITIPTTISPSDKRLGCIPALN